MTQEQAELDPAVQRELRRNLKQARRHSREFAEREQQQHVYIMTYWLVMIVVAVFLLALVVRKYREGTTALTEGDD